MLPPEQPASTPAPLMSAATRVFESRNRDRESDIMPIQFWPERKLPADRPFPSKQNYCEFKELVASCTLPLRSEYGDQGVSRRFGTQSGTSATRGSHLAFLDQEIPNARLCKHPRPASVRLIVLAGSPRRRMSLDRGRPTPSSARRKISKESLRRSGSRLARSCRADGMDCSPISARKTRAISQPPFVEPTDHLSLASDVALLLGASCAHRRHAPLPRFGAGHPSD